MNVSDRICRYEEEKKREKKRERERERERERNFDTFTLSKPASGG